MIYDIISKKFQRAAPDADLFLYETVEGILSSSDTDREKLHKIRCSYAAANAGKASRAADMRSNAEV